MRVLVTGGAAGIGATIADAFVAAWLPGSEGGGVADVLVGDPGRAFLPLARLRSIAQYPVRDFGDPQGAAGTGSVFEFVRGSSLV